MAVMHVCSKTVLQLNSFHHLGIDEGFAGSELGLAYDSRIYC